jgi:hypothetical protein
LADVRVDRADWRFDSESGKCGGGLSGVDVLFQELFEVGSFRVQAIGGLFLGDAVHCILILRRFFRFGLLAATEAVHEIDGVASFVVDLALEEAVDVSPVEVILEEGRILRVLGREDR